MAFERRYALGFTVRALLLALAVTGFAASLAVEGLVAARLVAGLIVVVTAAWLWRHVERTNVEIARFVEAVAAGDLSASFRRDGADSGFARLGATLDGAIRRLRDERSRAVETGRFYEALVDDAPTALLTVDAAGRIERANKAGRRLFDRHDGVRIADFAVYGPALVDALETLAPGQRRLVRLETERGPQRATIRLASVDRLAGRMRVIAVQPIQDALDAVELAAQSDLVRVLTHEIMNSITPVTSLARSAAALMAEADRGQDAAVTDARTAVETLARRADGVLHFVATYRQISRPPEIRRRRFAAAPFAEEARRLFTADWPRDRVALDIAVDPPDLIVDADPDLLMQVVINLLRNAAEAATASQTRPPAVALMIEATAGAATRITVSDSGAGVPERQRGDVFLPFYTTKPAGSGIGLSLARQVMLAHDGLIALDDAPEGGARFTLRF